MKVFTWKENTTKDHIPHSINRFIEYKQINVFNTKKINHNTTNIVVSDLSATKQMNHYSSCYVPNIYDIISNNEIISECESHSISKPSAVINIGLNSAISPSAQHIHTCMNSAKTDICTAIVVDEVYLNDRHTQNTYGFETKLATFYDSSCDDIIYSPCKRSIIAYQSFYSRANKLFFLNKHDSNWQLLTQVNWTKSASPATMVHMNDDKQLFISTNSGESIALDLVRNTWQKLPVLKGIARDYAFDEIPVLPQRPLFAYNKYHETMFRMNMNRDLNFYYDLHKNKWINMRLKNMISSEIIQQKCWFSDVSRDIMYAMMRTTNKDKNNVLYAYYDQRDHRQKKWKIVCSEK